MKSKTLLLTLVWGVALAAPLSFATNEIKVRSPEWNQKMQKLYSALTTLMVDLSETRYKDPKNASQIQKEIKDLSALAHELNLEKIADPSMTIFSENLSVNLDQASTAFQSGHRDYARTMLLQLTGACLTCHSRSDSGPQFGSLPFDIQKMGLKDLEIGEFYAATRQFDRALDQYQKIIAAADTQGVAPWDWQRSVEAAMAIAVRVKKDPAIADQIAQQVLTSSLSPRAFQQDVQKWRTSIADWKAESKKQTRAVADPYESGLKLIEKAKKVQTYPLDRSADILFLRGTAELHDYLDRFPKGPKVSSALLLLGQAYEVLDPRPTDLLHKGFYEACIRRAPHTATAMSCYRRYEQSTFFGFSGSSGTHLPQDVREKLLKLWGMAMPVEEKSEPKSKPMKN